MKNIPEKIYLQLSDGGIHEDFNFVRQNGEVTWNDERITKSDIEYVRKIDMPQLKTTYVVYFIDVYPDTGYVSQMKPVAYVENDKLAAIIAEWMETDDDSPCRTYKFTTLF